MIKFDPPLTEEDEPDDYEDLSLGWLSDLLTTLDVESEEAKDREKRRKNNGNSRSPNPVHY